MFFEWCPKRVVSKIPRLAVSCVIHSPWDGLDSRWRGPYRWLVFLEGVALAVKDLGSFFLVYAPGCDLFGNCVISRLFGGALMPGCKIQSIWKPFVALGWCRSINQIEIEGERERTLHYLFIAGRGVEVSAWLANGGPRLAGQSINAAGEAQAAIAAFSAQRAAPPSSHSNYPSPWVRVHLTTQTIRSPRSFI